MKLYIFPKKDGKNKQIFHIGKHYLGERGFGKPVFWQSPNF